MSTERSGSSRRDFLTGRSGLRAVEERAGSVGDAILVGPEHAPATPPSRGDTLWLATRAMNCEFAVVLNAFHSDVVPIASEALDLVHALEAQMTVYRETSELSALNREAASHPVTVEPRLFALLQEARRISEATGGAFDPTSGPLIALWRVCRDEGRIPGPEEVERVREQVGISKVAFDGDRQTVRFGTPGLSLNLGAIGKGHALDRLAERLAEQGGADFLVHGGQSSILARGDHAGTGGWPVGLRNPAFPTEQMATLLLRNVALSTSGAGEQFTRIGGRRYGHLLDPRTGWPAESMLSVTVLAPTAAEADALSTAFFVGGVEIARQYCDNHPSVGALFTPPLQGGRTVEIGLLNVPREIVFSGAECRLTTLG